MRRAENAGRHPIEAACGAARAGAQRAGTLAGDVAKDPPEGAEAPPARTEGDFGDRQIGVAQQRRRPLDAAREQIAVRWDAEGLAERAREMRR